MSGADKSDCASWCALPADHEGRCRPKYAATRPSSRVLSTMLENAAPEPPATPADEIRRLLEEHTRAVGLFLSELAEIMSVEFKGNQVSVEVVCTILLERARHCRQWAHDKSQAHAELLEAVRVRPSARAIKLLRAHQEAMEAMACDEEENIEAAALDTLLTLAGKITAVLKRHTEGG